MNRTSAIFRAGTFLVSALCILSLTGCFGVDGQFKKLRNTVAGGAGVDYTTDTEFGIGSFVIGMAKTVVSWSDDHDADVAVNLLEQIDKVQIGVYEIQKFDLSKEDIRSRTAHLIEYMNSNGYDAIVRNYEDNGSNLILVKSNPKHPEKIREVVVVSFDPHELNIVQMSGDVNEIVDVAAREHEVPGVDDAIEETK